MRKKGVYVDAREKSMRVKIVSKEVEAKVKEIWNIMMIQYFSQQRVLIGANVS